MTDFEFRMLLSQRLCDVVDVLLMRYRPCQIEGTRCLAGDLTCCYDRHYLEFNAEGVCPFLGESGCTVRRAKCKLWFCETVLRKADPQFLASVRILEQLLKLHDLGSRPYLGEGYVGRTAEIAALDKGARNG